MIRKLLITMLVVASVVMLQAQSDFARGFSSSAGMAGNVSYSFGNLFHNQLATDNFSVSEGVMHAQVIRVDIELAGCQNQLNVSPQHVKDTSGFFLGYEGEEMVFDGNQISVFPAGHYDSTAYEALHYNWDSQFNYDSLTTLVMEIYPIYEFFDTLYLDSTLLADYAFTTLQIPTTYAPLHGGPNKYYLHTEEYGCDSIRHFFVNLCGGLVKDGDGNNYPSLFVGYAPQRYCWTARNLRNTHDAEGNEIPNMIYYSQQFPNEEENLEQYGRLYTWYAAVGVPENSSDEPAITQNGGFVTGICPKGWHIPNAQNLASLTPFDAYDLMSQNLWLKPGTNYTGFNALPAGFYNADTERFENLLGQTLYWSTENESNRFYRVFSLFYGCNAVAEESKEALNGLSVRCVKNQIYDREGNELND